MMKARRFVAALSGLLLAAAPALRSGTSCDQSKLQTASMSAQMHHAAGDDQRGNTEHHPAKNCDTHDSDCCTLAAACGDVAFIAASSVSGASAISSQVIIVAEAFYASAPQISLDPPPPRA